MTRRQQLILVTIDRFGYWCMACGDVFGIYYLLDLFFPALRQWGYPFSGEFAFASALGLWMIAWLMHILTTGLEKRFKESP